MPLTLYHLIKCNPNWKCFLEVYTSKTIHVDGWNSGSQADTSGSTVFSLANNIYYKPGHPLYRWGTVEEK